jgi:fucose 4-O-acetylase-like acetyltransferase
MRGQAAIGRVPSAWDGPFQDALIYLFHMPLFFFLSGIVSLKSVQRKPFADSLGTSWKASLILISCGRSFPGACPRSP